MAFGSLSIRLEGKSSFLWSWKEQSQLDKKLSKDVTKEKRIINSMKSGVTKLEDNANNKETGRDRTKSVDGKRYHVGDGKHFLR